MLQASSPHSHAIRHNSIIEGSVNQQNGFFNSTNGIKGDLNIINYSSVGNRLYQRTDGSIGLAEKSIGFVIGEQIAPLIDSVSSVTKNIFGYLKGGLSRVFNFQILPGASAQELQKNVHDSWAKSALCVDFERKFSRGFLPIEDPIHFFSQETSLENLNQIVGNLTNLVKNEYMSKKMEEFDWLPDRIQSDSLATQLRAHSMITSVIHAYILEAGKFGSSCDAVRIPPKMLKAFMSSANSLNRPLTQTYETYILQNWKLIDSNKELSYENIDPLFTYTGLESEKWFIKVHVMSEYCSAPAIKSSIAIKKLLDDFLETKNEIDENTIEKLIFHMNTVETSLKDLAKNIARMKEGCKPDEFFGVLRPYLKNHPRGFFIDSGDTTFAPRGASGAQSSIIPAIDACFGIKVTQQETMIDMLNYMPPEHVELIEWLRSCNIENYLDDFNNQDLFAAYNAVVNAVAEVRRVHYNEIIEKYIVSFIPPDLIKNGILGTGGTDFTQFLPENIKDTEDSVLRKKGNDSTQVIPVLTERTHNDKHNHSEL